MTAPEATPRPWLIDPDPDFESMLILGPDEIIAADCCVVSMDAEKRSEDICKANAALIVRAVNAHDALVAALLDAQAYIASRGGQTGGERLRVQQRIRAALAAARGTP